MSDERGQPRPVNPHTGQPWPADEVASDAVGAPADRPAAPRDDAPRGPVPDLVSGPASPVASDASGAAPGPLGPASAAPGANAPSQQELAIRSALETVMDPEIGLSVIDLGLIREVQVQPGKTLVRMLLTTPFCPYAPQLMEDVKLASRGVVDQECEVEILPDPWSPEMMPDPGLLGFTY